MDAELKVTLVNDAQSGLKKLEAEATKTAQKIGSATARAASEAAASEEKAAARTRSVYQKMGEARERLGIRAERNIQREIDATRLAYKRLAASGSLSFREQALAADKMKLKVRELTNEMGKYTASQKAVGAAKGVFAMGLGVTAAGYALKNPAMEAMTYDERLVHIANTAYNERGKDGRRIGKKTIEGAVNKAVDIGGGTREDAATALDKMMASGAVSDQEALDMLPAVVKAAKAANTSAVDMGLIAVRAVQSFGIESKDVAQLLSAAMVAGQKGGFEVSTMAHFLPEQIAMAKNLGLKGKEDFVKLLAWNQASVLTAGSESQAGTNVTALLNDINSPHFKRFLSEELSGGVRAKPGDKKKRSQDVDALFLAYKEKGIDSIGATVAITQKLFMRDKKYQALHQELSKMDRQDPEREKILLAMKSQLEGSTVGKLLHNKEAMLPFLSILNSDAYIKNVSTATGREFDKKENDLESSVSHDLLSETSSFKLEHANELKKRTQKEVMDDLTPTIGKVADAFSDLARINPKLTGAVTLAAPAMMSFAAAAGMATLMMGRGGVGAGPATKGASWFGKTRPGKAVASTVDKIAQSEAGRKTTQMAKNAGARLKMGAKTGLAGLVALPVAEYALEKTFGTSEESKVTRYASTALNDAAIGATIGSIIPGVGTVVGGALGGLVGIFREYFKKPEEEKKEVEVKTDLKISLPPGVSLSGVNTTTTGGNSTLDVGDTGSLLAMGN